MVLSEESAVAGQRFLCELIGSFRVADSLQRVDQGVYSPHGFAVVTTVLTLVPGGCVCCEFEGLVVFAQHGECLGKVSCRGKLLLRAYDRTGQIGAHRPMRSRATCRHTWQRACFTGRPKLWAYTSSRGTAVASTS